MKDSADSAKPTLTGKMIINVVVDIDSPDLHNPSLRMYTPAVTYHTASDMDGITRTMAVTALYAATVALAKETQRMQEDDAHWAEVSEASPEKAN